MKGFEGLGAIYIGVDLTDLSNLIGRLPSTVSGFYGEDLVAVSEKISTYQNRKISSVETKLSNRK